MRIPAPVSAGTPNKLQIMDVARLLANEGTHPTAPATLHAFKAIDRKDPR